MLEMANKKEVRIKKKEKGNNKIKTWLATFLFPKVDPGDTASTKLNG